MTTLAQTVSQVRHDWLLTGHREQRNRLDGAITSSQAALTLLADPGAAKEGARLCIDYEEMWVWSASGKTISDVERAVDGTTAAAHDDRATIYVNSEFSPARVLRAVQGELASLPSAGLWRMASVDLTYSAAVSGYDLTGLTDAGVLSVYEVRARTTGPEKDWPLIDSWDLTRGMATSEFASSMAIILRDAGDPGQPIRVRYRAPFTTVGVTDDLTTVGGLPASAQDVVEMGAAIRLLSGREVKRNFIHTQGDTRRPEEVATGAQLQSVRGLLAQYERRLMEEKRRLTGRFPPRKRTTADQPGAVV